MTGYSIDGILRDIIIKLYFSLLRVPIILDQERLFHIFIAIKIIEEAICNINVNLEQELNFYFKYIT